MRGGHDRATVTEPSDVDGEPIPPYDDPEEESRGRRSIDLDEAMTVASRVLALVATGAAVAAAVASATVLVVGIACDLVRRNK